MVIVGILTLLSGIIFLFGSKKEDRPASIWYFLTSIFATIWLTVVALILTAKADRAPFMSFLFTTGFVAPLLFDACFLAFAAWTRRSGKVTAIILLLVALILSVFILLKPEWLYSNIIIANTGNSAEILIGPLLFCYIGYFAIVLPFISFVFLHRYRRARSKSKRIGALVAMITSGISGLCCLVANLILPLMHNWNHSWIGPLSFAIVIISIYYIILCYRIINLSYGWLRIFSYIVIVSTIAIVYMIIFSIIFAALFRGSTPSLEVIILNFIMLLIFISLIPAMNSFVKFSRRLILEQHPHHAKTAAKVPAKTQAIHNIKTTHQKDQITHHEKH